MWNMLLLHNFRRTNRRRHAVSDNDEAQSSDIFAWRYFRAALHLLKDVAWHHLMNFPDCVLNPHCGSWAVESDGGTFSEGYDDEQIFWEIIDFRNLARRSGIGCP
ncbi:hypothetical protein [Rhizobium herbae]|uniref:Uncharacterized protein n=1 Tax=Rhizobium herbae TaxID=508661 RepID=A0ABS4EPY4_9HYPH|nr:hypothetical protein [Rhizobium herbae]MBP1860009.1 hypothetical protein [Rhizobium herbae]